MNASQKIRALKQMPRLALAALGVIAVQGPATAQERDFEEGTKLYVSQCKICHGSVSAADRAETPFAPYRQPVRLAMHEGARSTRPDFAGQFAADWKPALATPGILAFAPPFGPPLRGVVGRPAGTFENFQYSATLLKNLKGMEWNEAALDVWIANPQAWVPGVYMFYKQPDREIRRKIILYLKTAE